MFDNETFVAIAGKIPIVTTVFSVYFFFILWTHYRQKTGAMYLLWWTIGVLCYGIGTLTESYVGLFGWNVVVFKSWYISGALLGGFPLAQGTAYLLLKRSTVNRITAVMVTIIITASVFVVLSPIDMNLVESNRLTGKVLIWEKVRMISPIINIYSLFMLVGGAIYSSVLYFKKGSLYYNRAVGNVFIAAGGLLPGIGGSFTRFGYTEVLYITELAGILLIFYGYHLIKRDFTLSAHKNQADYNSEIPLLRVVQ